MVADIDLRMLFEECLRLVFREDVAVGDINGQRDHLEHPVDANVGDTTLLKIGADGSVAATLLATAFSRLQAAVARAHVLVGSRRLLAMFDEHPGRKIVIGGDVAYTYDELGSGATEGQRRVLALGITIVAVSSALAGLELDIELNAQGLGIWLDRDDGATASRSGISRTL